MLGLDRRRRTSAAGGIGDKPGEPPGFFSFEALT